MRLPSLSLFQRNGVVVEVCATCEGRADKRGVSTVKAQLKDALEEASVLRDCHVVSAGCLSRCPLDGVTVRIDHDPREWTRAKVFVVDDEPEARAARTAEIARVVLPLVEERRTARRARSR